MNNKTVRIGNASGFWGDEPTALLQQLQKGKLRYVVADYLAEVSMSILAKQQAKNPDLGYIPDFLEHLTIAKDFLHQPVKIITNAGGNNPVQCAAAVNQLLKSWGIEKKVMAVTGDNILSVINHWQKNNSTLFANLETNESLAKIADKLVAANVYTNSEGILACLEIGADIVITGRASDSALVIGPLRYEFEWSETDFNKLGAAMIAGHIIECGAQATGGNFTDWLSVENMDTIGFPIIEMQANGDFWVTKPENTGGLVSVNTVKEQLVYEIANPKAYYGPDVIADISEVTIEEAGENKVLVKGSQGHPPTPFWKISAAYSDGLKAVGGLMIPGPNALAKAERLKDIFWKKLAYIPFSKTNTQFIGYNATATETGILNEPNEILIQFVAFSNSKLHLQAFAKQIAAMILVGPQGLAVVGGRPKPQEVVRYWPALCPVNQINLTCWQIDTDKQSVVKKIHPTEHQGKYIEPLATAAFCVSEEDASVSKEWVELNKICLARSGDKGNTSNIGVIARSPEAFYFLEKHLTPELLKQWFKGVALGNIERFDIPNLHAFNFFLAEALDGGGTFSGRIDAQGKSLASWLLRQKMEVPIAI
ncbi:MAG: acyclic terpene utilization AtuA family protein, partial [Chitinophagaceae bacterium]